MPTTLTIPLLKTEAAAFAEAESSHDEPTLYGVTDGKAVGTYFEQKFQNYLDMNYTYAKSSAARGIDFPDLEVDMKVTSIKQPQSSCPFRSARQKIYGLGYHLIVFVYKKTDDQTSQTGRLTILHTIFVDRLRTGDYQLTSGLRQIVENDGNIDDVLAYFSDKTLPIEEIQAQQLAEEVLRSLPELGYLTISNALQWRLQYRRVIEQAGIVNGVESL